MMKLFFRLGYICFRLDFGFILFVYLLLIELEQKTVQQINLFQILVVFNENESLLLNDFFNKSNLMALLGLHDFIPFLRFMNFVLGNFIKKCL